MTEVRIIDLLANSDVESAAHLDPKTVQKYAERRDDLPPVVVFKTSDGLLLVDGSTASQRRNVVVNRPSPQRCFEVPVSMPSNTP